MKNTFENASTGKVTDIAAPLENENQITDKDSISNFQYRCLEWVPPCG